MLPFWNPNVIHSKIVTHTHILPSQSAVRNLPCFSQAEKPKTPQTYQEGTKLYLCLCVSLYPCVCMCMRLCVCSHVCVYYVSMYVCGHVPMPTCMCARACVPTHAALSLLPPAGLPSNARTCAVWKKPKFPAEQETAIRASVTNDLCSFI